MTTLSSVTPVASAAVARRVGVYEIVDVLPDETIVTSGGLPFPVKSYGEFKYCDGLATNAFARIMASQLITQFGAQLRTAYIASSGVKHVASAAYHLTMATVTELALQGFAPKGLFRIDRGVVKAVDYATLNHEERAQSNAGRNVTLPEVSKRDIESDEHIVIVIDDIRISGATEEETRRALASAGIEDVGYAYLVLLDEQLAARDASIESRLNQSGIKTLHDLEVIVRRPGFKLNARTCKFILRAPLEDIRWFASVIPGVNAGEIVASMVADGYHRMPEYQDAFTAFCISI